jgi:threonine/homoserine/homoserine lactone efflux protein
VPAFLQGLLIGFSIAAPVGPIGLICIRRSLTAGRLAGLVSGLGAATADALYGIVAALGLTAVTNLLVAYQRPLQFVGGLFLVYLGLAIMRSTPATTATSTPPTATLSAAYFSTLLLTLANPVTVLSFLGIFAGLGLLGNAHAPSAAFALVLGVFLGSAAWWLLLSTSAAALGARLQSGGLRLLNLTSGALIAAFGLWQLFRLW